MRSSGLPLFLILGLTCKNILLVQGHGRLINPPSRSSMWRYGFATKPNYDDNALYCGGFQHQQKLDGKCGICGDPWDGERKNEAGGIYASGIISKQYDQGSTIDVQVEITADHKGWFEFRLCPNNNVTKAATKECLDKHLLNFENGETRYYLPQNPANKAPNTYSLKMVLPSDVTCTQCVLQWQYHTGNNWGCDSVADGGKCGLGHGPQEEFYGCSDIQIDPKNGSEVSTSTVTATTRNPRTTISNITTTGSPATAKETTTLTGSPATAKETTTVTGSPATAKETTTVTGSPATAKETTTLTGSPATANETTTVTGSPATAKETTTLTGSPATAKETTTVTGSPDTTKETTTVATTTITTKATTRATSNESTTMKTKTTTANKNNCRPTNTYKNVAGMQKWCINNCPSVNCAATHCICGSATEKRPRVCTGVGGWKGQPAKDTWCTNNCNMPVPHCPAQYCKCD